MGHPIRVALVGTYGPRPCGIATFTHDLVQALAEAQGERLGEGSAVQVVALTRLPHRYAYGPEVTFEIRDQEPEDYQAAASFLNLAPVDVVCLQHEYGSLGVPAAPTGSGWWRGCANPLS